MRAARGSTERGFPDLNEVAWWHKNSEDQTHPVRLKQPNAWGLYDMIGNVGRGYPPCSASASACAAGSISVTPMSW